MLPGIGSGGVATAAKVPSAGVTFMGWITRSWLCRKFQLFIMRRIVTSYPAEVGRQTEEQVRAGAGVSV